MSNKIVQGKIYSDEETLERIMKEEKLIPAEAKEVLELSKNTIKSE